MDKGGQSFSGIMKKFNVSKTPINTGVTALPQEIDWRSKGAVTPVKDASKCQHPYCSAIISMVRGYLHPYTRYNVIFKSTSSSIISRFYLQTVQEHLSPFGRAITRAWVGNMGSLGVYSGRGWFEVVFLRYHGPNCDK